MEQYNTITARSGEKIKESLFFMYKMHLAKEKQLQQTANKFKLLDDKFYGFFWAPLKHERKIQSEFRENFSSIDIERQKH